MRTFIGICQLSYMFLLGSAFQRLAHNSDILKKLKKTKIPLITVSFFYPQFFLDWIVFECLSTLGKISHFKKITFFNVNQSDIISA